MFVSGARQSWLSRLQKINYPQGMASFLNIPETELAYSVYSYFEKIVGKMCTRQSRKVIWDMINTLFLAAAVEPTFAAFLYYSQTYVQASRTIFSNFFEKQ